MVFEDALHIVQAAVGRWACFGPVPGTRSSGGLHSEVVIMMALGASTCSWMVLAVAALGHGWHRWQAHEDHGNVHSAGLDGFADRGSVHSAVLHDLEDQGNVHSGRLCGPGQCALCGSTQPCGPGQCALCGLNCIADQGNVHSAFLHGFGGQSKVHCWSRRL